MRQDGKPKRFLPRRALEFIGLNGPPALLFQPGDLIILSMVLMTEEEIRGLKPQVVFVDDENQLLRVEEHDIVIENQM